jgi:hypothetical protein
VRTISNTCVAPHETSTYNDQKEEKMKARIKDAQTKDIAEMKNKTAELVKKIQSNKRPRKNLFKRFRQSTLPLDELFVSKLLR